MSYNNSYASSALSSVATISGDSGNTLSGAKYSDVFVEGGYSGELDSCGQSCLINCSCASGWSSTNSWGDNAIKVTSNRTYYNGNSSPSQVTCYKESGCPDGYFEDKPDQSVFMYKTNSSGNCYKATGCIPGYFDSYDSKYASATFTTKQVYHDMKCYTVTCKSPYDGEFIITNHSYVGGKNSALGLTKECSAYLTDVNCAGSPSCSYNSSGSFLGCVVDVDFIYSDGTVEHGTSDSWDDPFEGWHDRIECTMYDQYYVGKNREKKISIGCGGVTC